MLGPSEISGLGFAVGLQSSLCTKHLLGLDVLKEAAEDRLARSPIWILRPRNTSVPWLVHSSRSGSWGPVIFGLEAGAEIDETAESIGIPRFSLGLGGRVGLQSSEAASNRCP